MKRMVIVSVVFGFFLSCTSTATDKNEQEVFSQDLDQMEYEDKIISDEQNSDADGNEPMDEMNEAVVYGTVNLNFTTDFILDNNKSRDIDYLEDHKTAIQRGFAFEGSLGSIEIPGNGIESVEAFPLKRKKDGKGEVIILQMVFDEENNYSVVNPFVQIAIPESHINQGEMVDVDFIDAAQIKVFDVDTETLAPICLHAVGFNSSLNVLKAENIIDVEGGAIMLQSKEIKLYHPTETPVGDISKDLISPAVPEICSKQ